MLRAKTLVLVFLRGGADGVALAPPFADDRLYELRPSLATARPDDRSAKASARTLDLDGTIGLHPALAPLEAMYRRRSLAVVTGVGSDDTTRSHFEAQDRMELAAEGAASGWLARHLATRPGPRPGPLSAVALDARAPVSLSGAQAAVFETASDLGVPGGEAFASRIGELYESASPAGPLGDALRDDATLALRAARSLAELPERAVSDGSPIEQRMREAARLIRARDELGIEAITLSHDGWDTHFAAGPLIDARAGELARAIAGLEQDLGDAWDDTVVVALSEFGRRAYENASLGTDHGRASIALVAGGGVRGGRVYGATPRLDEAALEAPGDLAVTTDYRAVLAEIVAGPLGNSRVSEVFPGFRLGAGLQLFG
jgi:uncharacterized protein (DUF1501 family)